MTILAVDPGATCGLSTGVVHWQCPAAEIQATLRQVGPTVVVCESFKVRRKATAIDALEVVQDVRTWCKHYEVPLRLQSPSTGKTFWTNDKLKKLGLYLRGQPHAMDALRHWLYYVTFTIGDKTYLDKLAQ